MVALIMLRPEEREVIENGGLYDPRYRPMDDDYDMDDTIDEPDSSLAWTSPADRKRAQSPLTSLEMLVASHHWRRGSTEFAVLMGRSRSDPAERGTGAEPEDIELFA